MVRLGEVNARRYHACLLMGSLVCLALFNLFSLHSLWGWLFLLAGTITGEASPLCDAGNGPGGDATNAGTYCQGSVTD